MVIKGDTSSKQLNIVQEDTLYEDEKIIAPYLNYDALRGLYAFNVYHKRSIRLKSMLLSQIEETTLANHLPPGITAKQFLFKFALNAETYGSAFFERAGTKSNFALYNLNTYAARVDRHHNIYEINGADYNPLDGAHFMYDTILSDHYGEPDYVAAINQIVTLYKADIYNANFFDNGAKPEMAFIFEGKNPSKQQVEAIKQYVKADLKGYKDSHKSIILATGTADGDQDPKIRIEELGKIEDMSFKSLKEVGRDEIIAAHGVPPRLVGVVNPNALGGGGELVSQLEMFNKITVMPKTEMFEEFFESHGIKLKIKPFDATAFKDDADVVSGLVATGILTPAEAKSVLGWSGKNGD